MFAQRQQQGSGPSSCSTHPLPFCPQRAPCKRGERLVHLQRRRRPTLSNAVLTLDATSPRPHLAAVRSRQARRGPGLAGPPPTRQPGSRNRFFHLGRTPFLCALCHLLPPAAPSPLSGVVGDRCVVGGGIRPSPGRLPSSPCNLSVRPVRDQRHSTGPTRDQQTETVWVRRVGSQAVAEDRGAGRSAPMPVPLTPSLRHRRTAMSRRT